MSLLDPVVSSKLPKFSRIPIFWEKIALFISPVNPPNQREKMRCTCVLSPPLIFAPVVCLAHAWMRERCRGGQNVIQEVPTEGVGRCQRVRQPSRPTRAPTAVTRRSLQQLLARRRRSEKEQQLLARKSISEEQLGGASMQEQQQHGVAAEDQLEELLWWGCLWESC
jgi:hypothetical protein